MEISQRAFLEAWKNRKLVMGALKAAHVRPDYSNYEDLLQEGLVVYARMLDQYQDRPKKEVDQLSFRKIIWATIDQLRKQQRFEEYHLNLSEQDDAVEFNDLDNLLLLKEIMVGLTTIEQLILVDNLLGREAITSLAQKVGCSRVQLQRCKRKLLVKLRSCLTK